MWERRLIQGNCRCTNCFSISMPLLLLRQLLVLSHIVIPSNLLDWMSPHFQNARNMMARCSWSTSKECNSEVGLFWLALLISCANHGKKQWHGWLNFSHKDYMRSRFKIWRPSLRSMGQRITDALFQTFGHQDKSWSKWSNARAKTLKPKKEDK